MNKIERRKLNVPYLKEKNILQLPVFYFGSTNLQKSVTTWEDENGKYMLKCYCDYGMPGAFEQDVYAACMRIWVLQGMPDSGIKLNYSDIARVLCLDPPKNWTSKIKKALMRLGLARYEFHHCFLHSNSDKTDIKQFSLFDTTSFFEHRKGRSKRNSESKIYFPREIQENLDEKYYQWLDMLWYRSLGTGLSRRLYEFLEKRRYHNVEGSLLISEESICRWLPLKDKNTTTRRRTLAKAAQSLIQVGYLEDYIFYKQKKQCSFKYGKNIRPVDSEKKKPAVEEKSTKAANAGKKQTITPEMQGIYFEALEWISGISYFRKERRREIAALPISHIVAVFPEIEKEYGSKEKKGQNLGAGWVYNKFMDGIEKQSPKESEVNTNQMDLFAGEEAYEASNEIEELFQKVKLKKRSRKLEAMIREYYKDYGKEYVEWNILYANKNAKKSYSPYLIRALKDNWAEEWKTEELEKKEILEKAEEKLQANLANRLEKKKKKAVEEKEAIDQRERFVTLVNEEPTETKKKLWKKADKAIAKNAMGRNMLVRIQYGEYLYDYFCEQGEEFPKTVLNDFDFVAKIAWK